MAVVQVNTPSYFPDPVGAFTPYLAVCPPPNAAGAAAPAPVRLTDGHAKQAALKLKRLQQETRQRGESAASSGKEILGGNAGAI